MRKRWMVLLAATGMLTLGGTAALAEKAPERISGKILEKARASVKRIEALIQAAKQGDPESQFELGTMIGNEGRDFVEVDAAALEWFNRAAWQGHGMAQMRLSYLYSEGGKGPHSDAVPTDYVQAYAWTTVSLNQGVQAAVWRDGVEQDPKSWLRTKMTAEQVAEAERLAAEFERKIRKNRSVERKSP